MNPTIEEALKHNPVQPGRPYRTRVNGQEIEVRVVSPEADSEETPPEEFWLPEPPAEKSVRKFLRQGKPDLPSPIHITDEDLSPE